ncbi:polysaccharide biosynthesis tyrosine autokinase [Geodermatophilus sp. SYSU D01106]
MELKDVLEAVRTRRRWIVGGLLAGLLAAGLLNLTAERTYHSTTELFISAIADPEEIQPLDADSFVQQRSVSYVQVLTGTEMAQRVVDDLRLPLTARELSEQITVTPLPGTVILEIEVVDTSPGRAQGIAESLVRQFSARVTELETPNGTTTPLVEVETLQPPAFDPVPVSPGERRNLMLGAALGLLVGLGLALLRHRTDTSVRREDHVAASTGAELVGRVFEDRQLSVRHVSPELDGETLTAEAYRTIRVTLRHVDGGRAPQVVVVTSALPGEGASTVAVNLSVSLARSGHRVMLVDGNLRRPRVARYLGLDEDRPGLTDLLVGTATLREAMQSWDDPRLTVVGAGAMTEDPDAVLDSPKLRGLLDVLRDEQDVIVIDTPPLLPVIDAAAVGGIADGCLLVTHAGRTRREELTEAATTLERVHARLLGVVLNRVPRPKVRRSPRRSYPADPIRSASAGAPRHGAHRRTTGRAGTEPADGIALPSTTGEPS